MHESAIATSFVNGAAGHLLDERDLVMILHFVQVQDEEASSLEPKIVRVDARNHIASDRSPLESNADR